MPSRGHASGRTIRPSPGGLGSRAAPRNGTPPSTPRTSFAGSGSRRGSSPTTRTSAFPSPRRCASCARSRGRSLVSRTRWGSRRPTRGWRRGRVEVQFTAAVRSGWTRTPIVLADLSPGHPEADSGMFVLFSGHLDSWYVGAMDNGSANAAMLEVTRILALHRERLRRGLRVAMWSGHSHGRYSSSTWYADTHWFDLADHCLDHVNIDSVGAIDADEFATNSMPETAGLGAWAVRQATGATLIPNRVGRNSDQSFLGIGIPSILGSISRQADGTLRWWWHTPHDTLDKIDPERLLRDTKIFVRVLERLLTDPVLPLDYAASASDARQNLEAQAKDNGAAVDLGPAISAAA